MNNGYEKRGYTVGININNSGGHTLWSRRNLYPIYTFTDSHSLDQMMKGFFNALSDPQYADIEIIDLQK